MARTLRRTPKELKSAPRLPASCAYLWFTFVDLCNACTGPIPYSEIDAYIRLTGNSLTPGEIDIIRALDDERRRVSAMNAASQ